MDQILAALHWQNPLFNLHPARLFLMKIRNQGLSDFLYIFLSEMDFSKENLPIGHTLVN